MSGIIPIERVARLLPGYERKRHFAERQTLEQGFPAGLLREPVIVRGIIYRFQPVTGDAMLRTKQAVVQCRWYKRTIPPGVRRGDKVVIIGCLLTSCWGRRFLLTDCMIFKDELSYKEFKKEFSALLKNSLLLTHSYIGGKKNAADAEL